MAGFCHHPAVHRLDDTFNRKILKPHFLLQFLVNPEAGKNDNSTVIIMQVGFTIITFDPQPKRRELQQLERVLLNNSLSFFSPPLYHGTSPTIRLSADSKRGASSFSAGRRESSVTSDRRISNCNYRKHNDYSYRTLGYK